MRLPKLAFTDDSFPDEMNYGPNIILRDQIRPHRRSNGAMQRGSVRAAMEARIEIAHEQSMQRLLGPDWALDYAGVPTYLPAQPWRLRQALELVAARRAEAAAGLYRVWPDAALAPDEDGTLKANGPVVNRRANPAFDADSFDDEAEAALEVDFDDADDDEDQEVADEALVRSFLRDWVGKGRSRHGVEKLPGDGMERRRRRVRGRAKRRDAGSAKASRGPARIDR